MNSNSLINIIKTQRFSAARLLSLFNKNESTAVIDPPEDASIDIPEYKGRINEDIEARKARLLYQSRKRGMLENGLLLSTFAAEYLNKLTEKQLSDYDSLINKPSNDWDIFYWVTGVKPTPKEYEHDVMNMLKEHAKNVRKEQRLTQPDLY